MKKVFFKRAKRSAVLLSLLCFSAFLFLEGCCFMYPGALGARRPCNCTPHHTAYTAAVNHTDDHTQTTANQLNNTVPGPALSGDASFTEEATENLRYSEVASLPNTTSLPMQTGNAARNALSQNMAEARLSPVKTSEKKLPLGIKAIRTHVTAGPNMSFKSSKENYGNTNHKHTPGLGFQLGFGTTYDFSAKFAVTPSLLLKHNTATETLSYNAPGETGGGGSTQEYKTKYSYTFLSVPIMAGVKLSDQVTVMAGPEVNLLLGAKTKSKTPGSEQKTDIKSSSVTIGVGVQAGIKYNIPNSPVGLQLIYDHRISRLNKKTAEYSPGGGYSTPAWNMQSIQLGVTCAICEFLKGRNR